MAQFDVYQTSDGDLLIDCQSAAFADLTTRIVAPLLPITRSPERRARLNPEFEIDGERCVMVTQFAAAIDERILGNKVASLSADRFAVIDAFDMLLTGV